jgi:hypothetical protein
LPKYQSQIIVTLESEDILNEKWLDRRFKSWMALYHQGFKVKEIAFEPNWKLVKEEKEDD